MRQVFCTLITGTSLLLGSLALFSCGGAETDKGSETGEKSYLRTRDDISQNVRQYFEEMSKENIAFAETFYGDELQVWVNDIEIKGKEAYVERLNRIHKVLLKDMTVEKLHVHTNHFSPEALTMEGKTVGEMNPGEETIWSNAWAIVNATGRVTGKEIAFRMHMDFRTLDGKVVEMLAFYDPSQLNAEIAALEASEASDEEAAP